MQPDSEPKTPPPVQPIPSGGVKGTIGPSRVDPLADWVGRPLISAGSGHYVGRLIIELWENHNPLTGEKLADSFGLAYAPNPAPGEDSDDLIYRISAAFPVRIAQMHPPVATKDVTSKDVETS